MIEPETHCPIKEQAGELNEERKDFVLPPWRVLQILTTALDTLVEEDFLSDDFDYMEMIRRRGIKLKPYSAFSQEHLKVIRKMSLSFWKEGLCLAVTDEKQGQCRMIAYNDKVSDEIKLAIIMHEFGHIVLKHTQQSEHGEAETLCFATVMMTALSFKPSLSAGNESGKTGGRDFLQGILISYIRNKQREVKIKKNEA